LKGPGEKKNFSPDHGAKLPGESVKIFIAHPQKNARDIFKKI
jgi:hypothetical protein